MNEISLSPANRIIKDYTTREAKDCPALCFDWAFVGARDPPTI